MLRYAGDAMKCLLTYRTFLDEVHSWLDGVLRINSTLPLLPADRKHVVIEVEHELSWLRDISRRFLVDSMVSYVHATFVRQKAVVNR